MSRGINNSYLYSACKIISMFSNGVNEISCQGTGFFVNKEGIPFLITNRHMIDCNYPRVKYEGYKIEKMTVDNRSFDKQTSLPTIVTEFIINNINDFAFSSKYENDIACLRISELSATSTFPQIAFSIPYSLLADEDGINRKLAVCDEIGYPGFPAWFDSLNNNPIFRIGVISSDPRFDYSVSNKFMGNCIAYEGFSFGGSSGSPVFALQVNFPVGGAVQASESFYREVMLVGVNAGHFSDIDGHHSGISYFYKSSEIKKIIDSL